MQAENNSLLPLLPANSLLICSGPHDDATLAGMNFGKLLVLLLGLAIVAFAVKYELTGGKSEVAGRTEPKRQLDNVREKSHALEQEMQKTADELGKKAEAQ